MLTAPINLVTRELHPRKLSKISINLFCYYSFEKSVDKFRFGKWKHIYDRQSQASSPQSIPFLLKFHFFSPKIDWVSNDFLWLDDCLRKRIQEKQRVASLKIRLTCGVDCAIDNGLLLLTLFKSHRKWLKSIRIDLVMHSTPPANVNWRRKGKEKKSLQRRITILFEILPFLLLFH